MEKRGAQRVSTQRDVFCRVGEDWHGAIVFDLATDGCMLELSGVRPTRGMRIMVRFEDDFECEGTIIWHRSHRAGVRFDESLHPVMVQYAGYRQPADPFAMRPPRDKFGRVLPALRKRPEGRAA